MSTVMLEDTAVVEPPAPARVVYPSSDGEPLSDSDDQYQAMTDAKFALVAFFRGDPRVYVAANLLIYYKKGDPTKRVAPDVFFVRGVSKRMRSSYKLWIERQLPGIVFEIASPGTWEKDVQKQPLYESLGIPEYVMFDPFGGEYFDEPLIAFRLVEGHYQPMPPLPSSEDEAAGVLSEQLGLEIWAKPGGPEDSRFILRFRNPQTGEWLLSQSEADLARREAEARVAALEAELDKLRGERK